MGLGELRSVGEGAPGGECVCGGGGLDKTLSSTLFVVPGTYSHCSLVRITVTYCHQDRGGSLPIKFCF